MNLARLEAGSRCRASSRRFPDYALDGEPVRGGRARFRGFLHLPRDRRLSGGCRARLRAVAGQPVGYHAAGSGGVDALECPHCAR